MTLKCAIAGGCADVPGLKACTAAGTSCGSCVPLLKQLLEAEGVEQSKALCEHFSQSRAELFEIISATEIRTFSGLLERFGRGKGCDICKPAVASILASTGSDHILDGEQASLQDSNDHFLANIQKNGSYSVVPRVPGGDIKPEHLILIGQIAQDFGLYTKITGGQRIDMFGARVDQLPEIWKRLVDGGMESGHAYGKALRTVKSCVGSDWCRYGQQDSVQMAIDLELRYRGLRAPHKIKLGVSGCARECAEARSKDVGVIATEKGWNLYVGGNGGMTPKHAQLLASDLDTETLVRYIDRFLMYYIRTADRLQRTAPWVESLDGGLDHVREVVCDDSLGLAGEFEAAMERHVQDYKCEWKGVLEDPDKLSRFVSFVNAPDVVDSTVTFTERAGRKVPVPIGMPRVPIRNLQRRAGGTVTLLNDIQVWTTACATIPDPGSWRGCAARRRLAGGVVPAGRRFGARGRQHRSVLRGGGDVARDRRGPRRACHRPIADQEAGFRPRRRYAAWTTRKSRCRCIRCASHPRATSRSGGSQPPWRSARDVTDQVALHRRADRVDERIDRHRVQRLGAHPIAHDAQADQLGGAQRRPTATLSAPSIFNNGPKNGPTNMLSTISAVLATPVDAMALAAKGPPPAASQVVINMCNVRRPTWLTPPVTIRSMNSGVPKGNRSIFATGSRSPRDGSARRGMVSGSPARDQRSSAAGVGAPRQLGHVRVRSLSPQQAGSTRREPPGRGTSPGAALRNRLAISRASPGWVPSGWLTRSARQRRSRS